MRVRCPKCGVSQDPTKPRCVHLAGRKGGGARARKHGRAALAAAGKRGGLATKKKHGRKHFVAAGRKGGKS